jgi:polysaccharide export outer membrane protein
MVRIRVPLLVCLVLLGGPLCAAEPTAGEDGRATYVIGIEDVLRVVVWGEADLSLTVKVRPDGRITLPLIHDVAVAGQTPERLRAEIADRLGKFLHEPNVTVIVEQNNSFRVYFLGEIANQGALLFYRPTRLLQGIASAGGLTDFAKKEITLLREQGGVEKRLSIDYKRLFSGDSAQENIYLQPGDTLLFH